MTLDQLNALDQAAFTTTLGSIFEHSPWVAARSWDARPFASVDALHAAMCLSLARATREEQLALICAHPQLASRAAVRGELTDASNREQGAAGLRQCSADEFAVLQRLNADYLQRFAFPFILAVRGHTPSSVIAAFTARLGNTPEEEFAEALRQIERIAAVRLADTLDAH